MIPTLFLLSLIGGFFAGLLGVGGAVVLIPLMFTVPQLVGVGSLTMNEVAGITMVQVLFASAFGCIAHRRAGLADTKTIVTIGIPLAIMSLAGATLSKSIPSHTMLILFGCLVAFSFALLLKKAPGEEDDSVTDFQFKGPLSAVIGAAVGFVAGILGAGGGFILVPLMIRVLKMPMRVTIGSSLGIIFIGAIAGSIGKMLTMQVPWMYLLPVIAGSIPAVLLGASVSRHMPPVCTRYALLTVVFVILVKTWVDILA
jgi:uncharacterized membrane protein YfcA